MPDRRAMSELFALPWWEREAEIEARKRAGLCIFCGADPQACGHGRTGPLFIVAGGCDPEHIEALRAEHEALHHGKG